MKHAILSLGIVALAAGSSAKEKAADAPVLGIELTGDYLIAMKINGVAVQLKADPSVASIRGLNPDIAQKAQLKPSPIGMATSVGPVRIRARTDRAEVDYGMVTAKDRVLWPDRPITNVADGVVGPGGLPYQRVTFRLAPSRAGEKTISLPMDSLGMFGVDPARTTIAFGDQKIGVTFSLLRDETLATAPTGNLMARQLKGVLASETTQAYINYGISRPVRRLVTEKELEIGGRVVDSISVRVSDFGDATTIPGKEAPLPDPDEIVVEAKKGKKQRHELVLGRAFLKGCSTLTYDFPKKRIILSCT